MTATVAPTVTPVVNDERVTSWASAATDSAVPVDVLVPTDETSLDKATNPKNGRRGLDRGHAPTTAAFGCVIDLAAPRPCLVSMLDALGFNVAASGAGADVDRRLVQAIATVQRDAGLAATGVPDEAFYRYLGIWPGTPSARADEARALGLSQQGRPIQALRYGNGSKVVLVVAQTHGDEEAGLRVWLRLRQAPLPAGVTVWLVPTLDPDGLARDTRFLADGSDPNRTAPTRPEQKLVFDFAVSIRPVLGVYYHQNYGWIGGSGASMDPAQAYFDRTKLGELKRSGDCKWGFVWCAIDDAVGSSSILVELPDVVAPSIVRDHAAALLSVAAAL